MELGMEEEYDDEKNADTFDSPLIRDLRQEMGLVGGHQMTDGLKAMSLEELEQDYLGCNREPANEYVFTSLAVFRLE